MAKFKYPALDDSGSPVSGEIDSDNTAGAGIALLERGLMVTELAEKKSILQFEITKKKLPRKELMHFSRQLSVFLRSGIPVTDALDVIQSETKPKSVMFAALADMMEQLRAGSTFTGSARLHPECFPPFYIGVLDAAEMTGNLPRALDEVADYIDRDLEAKRKVQSALFYPAVVAVMSLATVLILCTFVLPRFAKFFEELHADLPLPTRMLLAVSDFFTTMWPLLLLGAVGGMAGLWWLVRTPKGQAIRDRFLLKFPVLGDLIHTAIVERFCRTLSSMVRSGVPLPDALTVTSDGTNNVVFREGLEKVKEQMMEGHGLAGPIAETELFPGAARQMIRVGEETGTLDMQLETAAVYYGRDLDFKIARFTNLFEPAVILFMGLVVGFVAIALVSAMYGIFGQMETMPS